MKTETIQKLRELSACEEAVQWLAQQKTIAQAWQTCARGDWMLWLLGRLAGGPGSASRKKLVLAACQCARLALRHVPEGEKRPLHAIQTAERWARGERGVTLSEVKTAAYASSVYAYSAAAASCAYSSAYAAAFAAANAAYAYYAATYAAYAYKRAGTLKQCADIVRQHFPKPPRVR